MPSANKQGNSATLTAYSYTDHPTGGGRLSYRIKQIDLDGNASYSDIAVVNVPGNAIYPKIVAEGTTIRILMSDSRPLQSYDVLVYDTQGRTLRHQQLLTAPATLITGLPDHNLYYVQIVGRNGQEKALKAVWLN